MAGNRIGGLKAKAKNLANNPNFYRDIGRVGGTNGTGHKFAHGKLDPREMGAKGGRVSKRRKNI